MIKVRIKCELYYPMIDDFRSKDQIENMEQNWKIGKPPVST